MLKRSPLTAAAAALAATACFALAPTAARADFGYLSQWGSTGNGDGQFQAPVDLSTDAGGNVYVVDNVLDSVQKFNPDGQFMTSFGAPPAGQACTDTDQTPPVGQLCVPNGISVNQYGVYVMSTYAGRIERFTQAGNSQSAWGHLHCATGTLGATPPPKPWFCFPPRVATNSAGYVYADDATSSIQVFDQDGTDQGAFDGFLCAIGCLNQGLASTPPSSGMMVYSTDSNWATVGTQDGDPAGGTMGGLQTFGLWGGAGASTSKFGDTAAQPGPRGIAVAPNGDVYVADNANNRIQVFQGVNGASLGEFKFAFGSLGSGPGQFNDPQGVTIDSAGNVYVADTGNDRVQKFGNLPTPPTPPTPTPTPTPTPSPNTTPPQLAGLRVQNPIMLQRHAKHTRRNRKIKKRTFLRYVLNEPATVTIRVSYPHGGKTIGTFTRPAFTGINRFPFTGKVAGRFLRAGVYKITVQGTDASGAKTASQTVTLRVVR